MNDPTKATALAMGVLGRSGAQVLPMLKQGGDKLKGSFEELEKRGGGFTEAFIAGAEEAERAQVKWDMSTRSLKVAFVQGLLPAITAIVDWGTKAARAIAVMPVPHHGLGEAINDRLRRAAVERD